jgi:hypothetical protein
MQYQFRKHKSNLNQIPDHNSGNIKDKSRNNTIVLNNKKFFIKNTTPQKKYLLF